MPLRNYEIDVNECVKYGTLMRKIFIFLFLIAAVFLCRDISAYESKTTKKVLDNGLTVLVSELPTSPFVSIYIMVKAGSATEGKFLGCGISHFVEHMLFKGTSKRGAGEIAAEVQANGGMINAATGKDYTIYKITIPYEKFDIALDILVDMITDPLMDVDEMEKERDVIIKEIRMHEDNPDSVLTQLVFDNVFSVHPYKYPVIGYESLFKEISNEELIEYYKTYYVPNNMILSIAGNVDAGKIFPEIESAFAYFERGRCISRNLVQEPQQISERRAQKEYPVALARMSIAFSSVRMLDKDLFALDVLSIILGHGKSSHLYKDVFKEKNLVYEIRSTNYTPVDKGAFEIDCLLEEENIEDAIEAIFLNVEKVQKKGINKDELDKAKRWVVKDYIFGHQKSSQLAFSCAYGEAFVSDYQFGKKYVESIKDVTSADVKRVANKYLNKKSVNVSILRPPGSEAQEVGSDKENKKAGEISKHVLDNGVTVLIREDHTFPVVSVRAVFNGGIRQEPRELLGISSVMASLMSKGTKSFSADRIAEISESSGMEFGTYSGRNSFGVSVRLMTEDLGMAFNIFKDVIKNPVFPESEMPQIKDRMRAGIRQRKDSIYSYADQNLRETLFLNNTFKYDGKGEVETIDRITRDDVADFYNRLAVGENLVIAVFGDIDSSEILKMVKNEFGDLRSGSVELKNIFESEFFALREKGLLLEKNQAMIMFGFHGPKIGDKERYGVDVLSEVLGSPFNGRLFSCVREKLGKAYALGANYLPSGDAGYIYFYVLTTNENIDKVKDLVKKEIMDVRSRGVTDKELDDVKAHMKGRFKKNLETNDGLCFISMLDELYGLGYDNFRKFDEEVDAVNKGDVKRLAIKYLDLNKAAVVVVKSEEKEKE